MWETLPCPICGMPVQVDVKDDSGRTLGQREQCENERNRMHRPVPDDEWQKTL